MGRHGGDLCPDINQEAMLAVAWGQAVILQRHLESDAANLLAPTASGDDDKPPPDDLLQIALQHKDVNVVQTLLDFTADPTNLVLDELFKEEFDRYPLPETKGLWLKPKVTLTLTLTPTLTLTLTLTLTRCANGPSSAWRG